MFYLIGVNMLLKIRTGLSNQKGKFGATHLSVLVLECCSRETLALEKEAKDKYGKE